MPHHIGGLPVYSREEAERLLAPFLINLTISRQAIDAWSRRRLTEDMSDDQMQAFAAKVKVSLEEVAFPELVQTAYEQIVNYVSIPARTRKPSPFLEGAHSLMQCESTQYQRTLDTIESSLDF